MYKSVTGVENVTVIDTGELRATCSQAVGALLTLPPV